MVGPRRRGTRRGLDRSTAFILPHPEIGVALEDG